MPIYYNNGSIILNALSISPELFLPVHMMNHLKLVTNQLWSLQNALAYLFYQYLSKLETLQTWTIRLDMRIKRTAFVFNPLWISKTVRPIELEFSSQLERLK